MIQRFLNINLYQRASKIFDKEINDSNILSDPNNSPQNHTKRFLI